MTDNWTASLTGKPESSTIFATRKQSEAIAVLYQNMGMVIYAPQCQ